MIKLLRGAEPNKHEVDKHKTTIKLQTYNH